MGMELEAWEGRAELLSPLKGFEREVQVIEYRRDPLTGHITALVKARADYVLKYFRPDLELLEELVASSRRSCPFCPEAIEERTPLFPPDLLPEGRLKVGDCWAIPSLFSHSELNAIVVLGREHFRRLDQMDERLLADGLTAAIEVLRSAKEARPDDLRYGTVIMNYAPTAGASQIHPHMQVLATKEPFNALGELISLSLDYRERNSRCFWEELVELEADRGERLVGRVGNSWWLAPFAPKRRYEVWGLLQGRSDLLGLRRGDVEDLAGGLSRLLRAYHDLGICSFNMAILAGPLGEDVSHYFWLQVRICARFGLKKSLLSDFWALPVLLNQDEVFESPESYAARFRPYLQP